MHQVAHDQQLAVLEHGVAGSVAVGREGGEASGEHVAVVEQVEPVAVGLHGPDGLVVAVAGSGPCVVFNLGGVDLRVGEHDAVAGHHAADVVAMKMSQVEITDVCG